MRQDFTDITVVMDCSGSMASCRSDAEGGLNSYIEQQKKVPGKALFSLVQFDTKYEFKYKGTPLQEVGHCTLNPGGMTALLDAVGRAITETGDRLRQMPESERPGLVVFMIITDGQENASREYTRHQIRQMIEHQQSKYNWQFSYLGANQDAFAEAASYGINLDAVANYAATKSVSAYNSMSSNTTRMRTATAMGLCAKSEYTVDEKADMAEDDDGNQRGWTAVADQTAGATATKPCTTYPNSGSVCKNSK